MNTLLVATLSLLTNQIQDILTDVVEIIGGDLKKTIMVGDSEVDANSAHNANLPFILVKDGYTEKTEKEIKHDDL